MKRNRAVMCVVVLSLCLPMAASAQDSYTSVVYGDDYSDSSGSDGLHPYYGGPTNPFFSGPDPKYSESFVRQWQGYSDHFIDSGWYLTGLTGFQFLQEQTSSGSPNRRDDVRFNGGPAAGGGVGYRLGRFRYEAVFEYRSNTEESLKFNGVAFDARGFARTYSGMFNFHMDFMPIGGVTPYIGGGIGVAQVDEDIRYGNARLVDSEIVLAYQALVGLSKRYQCMEQLEWFAECRYFGTTDPDLNRFGGPAPAMLTTMRSEYHTIGAMFGLRVDLH